MRRWEIIASQRLDILFESLPDGDPEKKKKKKT